MSPLFTKNVQSETCATGLCLLRHNESRGYRACKCAGRGQGTTRVRSGFHCRLQCAAVALPVDTSSCFVTLHEGGLVYELMEHFGACQTARRLSSCACLGQRQLHLSNDAFANVQVLVICPAALVEDSLLVMSETYATAVCTKFSKLRNARITPVSIVSGACKTSSRRRWLFKARR